jgi:hypothetical protein
MHVYESVETPFSSPVLFSFSKKPKTQFDREFSSLFTNMKAISSPARKPTDQSDSICFWFSYVPMLEGNSPYHKNITPNIESEENIESKFLDIYVSFHP